MSSMHWLAIDRDLWLFPDSCNVYAVRGTEGMLFVDAGTGAWLDHVGELPGKPSALVLTHHFRDHAAGALRAAGEGIAVYAPEGECEMLADPVHHFNGRSTYVIYDNLWNLNVPIEPLPLAGGLRDYETVRLAGLDIEVLPLPGATLKQSGYALTTPSGRRIVFCGETFHSPGRVPRVAPWQYNYNDFRGAQNTAYSLRTLHQRAIDILAPSLGRPVTGGIDMALAETEAAIDEFMDAFGRGEISRAILDKPQLEKVTDHVYRGTVSNAVTWFLIGESGKVLSIDYGYNWECLRFPEYARPENRRPLLHSLEDLKRVCGADRIDVVLLTHYHDDHTAGVPLLQRLHGTRCWASEAFADLIEHPETHCFPCNWPEPIAVDQRISLDETVRWEQFEFHFGPMSGHTRFASLIGFESDGKRFAHTGDQVFFYDSLTGDKSNKRVFHNHVYRNGALLDGYHQCAEWLERWRPHYILTGHTGAIQTDETHVERVRAGADEYRNTHQRILPLGPEEAHFNIDGWGGWISPWRVHLVQPKTATVRVTVRNPFSHEAELHVRLVGPSGWRGSGKKLRAAARAEVSCELEITPSAPCRRQPFAAELTVEGKPFGQVAEALMTAGYSVF